MWLRSHSNNRRLRVCKPVRCIRWRVCKPVRCTRKRWASGTSHLTLVKSQREHGLQEPFSAQPKAMSLLATTIRSRLETSLSLIYSRASGPDVALGPYTKASSQSLAERLTCESFCERPLGKQLINASIGG